MTDPEKLLDVDEVAAILGMDDETVLRLLRSGALKGIDVSTGTRRKRWRVRPSDLTAWQKSREVKP